MEFMKDPQMTTFVASEDPNDPLFLGGIEGLPINLLDEDMNAAIDIDDLLSLFDDDHQTASDSRVSQTDFLGATPTTSESGNGHLHSRTAAEKGDLINDTKGCVEEEKRLARMKRNRENAHLSRMRKKQQLLNLQQSCQSLKHQNSQLNLFIQRLAAENCLLRHHLKEVCKNANYAVPSVPSVLGVSPARVTGVGDTEDSDNLSQQSKLAENKLKKCAPRSSEIADTSIKSSPLAKEKRGAKRKTVGGVGAAFLTLLSIFLFAGPMGIVPNESVGTQFPKMLPEGQSKTIMNLASQQGRSLMAVEETMSEDVNLSDYFSKTVEALLKDKENIDLPKQALSSLEDIAPHVLSLDKNPNANDRSSLPASSVFTALAERFFESSGLDAPQLCEKVFTFHSDDISSQYNRKSKKSIEKYILGTHGFKGRSSGLRVQNKRDTFTELVANDESRSFGNNDEVLLPTQVSEPQLVSVMLPANSSRPKRSGITAIDHLYVVILDPQNTFSTYACQLPKSLVI